MMKKFITIGIICLLLLVSIPSIVGVDKELLSMHENHPPEPYIDGPDKGKVGVTYTFICSAIDPDEDDVSFLIDWGDGSSTDWSDYYFSGTEIMVSHKWSEEMHYAIVCRVKDSYGAENCKTHLFVVDNKKSEPTVFDDDFEIEVTWETYYDDGWFVQFIVTSNSTLDRIEFFINDGHHETVTGSGPVYEFSPLCWSKTLAKSTFTFVGYGVEGGTDTVIINGSDIKSYPRNQFNFMQSFSYVGIQRFLEKFSLLQQILLGFLGGF